MDGVLYGASDSVRWCGIQMKQERCNREFEIRFR
jgi:hypothetical protein